MLADVFHASGRFDRPVASLDRAVAYYRTKGSAGFHTETSGLNARELIKAFGGKGWSFAHVNGVGASECVTEWKDRTWDLIGDPFARKITDKTWVRSDDYGGKKAAYVRALVTPLIHKPTRQQVITVVAHMPLDNQPRRQAAWVDCCRGLVDLKHDMRQFWPRAKFVISADWNKNFREADERHQLHVHAGQPLKMDYCWGAVKRLPATGGTHPQPGKDALIDGFYSDLPIKRCYLLRDDPSSDHRAMGGSIQMGEKH